MLQLLTTLAVCNRSANITAKQAENYMDTFATQLMMQLRLSVTGEWCRWGRGGGGEGNRGV